jgi:SAM-dependent methyltransferase
MLARLGFEKSLIEEFACIACEGSSALLLGARENYSYYVCQECATVQIWPLPDRYEVEKLYANSEFATASHGQGDADTLVKSSHSYYLNIAEALIDHGVDGMVIDYGAGYGGLCGVLMEKGFKCAGIELSANMVHECRERGLPVYQKSLSSLVDDGIKASAVVLCGVFEHLSDPRNFLSQVHAILEPNGLLISLQPTGTFARLLAYTSRITSFNKQLPSLFYIFDAPWHIALYSLDGMSMLARSNGFELSDVRFAPQGRSEGFYGVAQGLLEWTNRLGWAFFKSSWPLMISHTFVFKKRSFIDTHHPGRIQLKECG